MSSIQPDQSSGRDGAGRSAPISSDELLPPVEPPSAGFLLQLFVVPAVIVACVVLVWFVIESLARRGEQDADAIVAGLRSPTQGFQQAKDLADMLRVPERYPELKVNHELAGKLGELVAQRVDEGNDDEAAVNMRFFLVAALGEFQVDDGLPALVKAAQADPDRDIRRKAVNSIAVLAGSLARLKPPQYLASDELVDALVQLARDKDELLRSETAFAIGVLAAAPDADSRLAEMLRELADDPYTDARFNAAAALARLGSPLAPKAVAELLDPEAVAASLSGEKPITANQSEAELRSQRAYKRNTILTSALRAIDALVDHQPPPDSLEVVEDALAKFIAAAPTVQDPAPLPDELVEAAQETLAKVQAARKR